MAAYAWTPSALTWLHVNHLINGLHKQISWKNCLYADNLYFTLASVSCMYTYKTKTTCKTGLAGLIPFVVPTLIQNGPILVMSHSATPN